MDAMTTQRGPRLNPLLRQPGGGWYLPVSLKRVREAMGVSQSELARRSGIARQTIMYVERGDRMARAATLKKIADGLGVEPMDLVVPIEEERTPDMR